MGVLGESASNARTALLGVGKRRALAARAVTALAALAVAVPAALGWSGRPATAPPSPPQSGSPPPAWIETQARAAWLAFGSYCWKTSCIDMIAPEARPDLPVFTARRRRLVRVHLGFAAKSATVSIDKKTVRARLDKTRRIVFWTARRAGILSVFLRASGDASYVARLRIR